MKNVGALWTAILIIGCLFTSPLLRAQTQPLEPTRILPSNKSAAKHRVRSSRVPVIDFSKLPLSHPSPPLFFVPSSPAIVDYHDGALTIHALNTPLNDVLHQVCKNIDASLEIPPGVDDPVFGKIGPGTARAVIASLLYGAEFNYVLSLEADNPNQVTAVVLSRRPPPPPTTDKKGK